MTDLIFDTETTGLVDFALPISEEKQPHLLQLAALLVDDEEVLAELNVILYWPDLKEISKEAIAVHHLTLARCHKKGVPPLKALQDFDGMVRLASCVVAHNVEFDDVIMRAAYHRVGGTGNAFTSKPRFCTMQSAQPVLKLPPKKEPPKGATPRYRFPSLDRAYRDLVDEAGFENAHEAMADARACHAVLVALRRRKAALIYKKPYRSAAKSKVNVDMRWLGDLLQEAENREGHLTEWERSFVADIGERHAQYGDDLFVSPKQHAILIRIEGKLHE